MNEKTKELVEQGKRELSTDRETTMPGRFYQPDTDIYETADALHVLMDMAGVAKEDVKITLEKDRLTVEGRIDHKRYEHLRPIYSEYNVGHYTRSFQLSSVIDKGKTAATMADGVLSLTLPKAEQEKPKLIAVS